MIFLMIQKTYSNSLMRILNFKLGLLLVAVSLYSIALFSFFTYASYLSESALELKISLRENTERNPEWKGLLALKRIKSVKLKHVKHKHDQLPSPTVLDERALRKHFITESIPSASDKQVFDKHGDKNLEDSSTIEYSSPNKAKIKTKELSSLFEIPTKQSMNGKDELDEESLDNVVTKKRKLGEIMMKLETIASKKNILNDYDSTSIILKSVIDVLNDVVCVLKTGYEENQELHMNRTIENQDSTYKVASKVCI
jgi:hypothetical protein